jgi:hypothetical protein
VASSLPSERRDVFFKGSRYANLPVLHTTDSRGRVVAYKATRVIGPSDFVSGHLVVEGDRLDRIAYDHYRDPERFWRICDANVTMWPEELVSEPGRVIGIPSPEETRG